MGFIGNASDKAIFECKATYGNSIETQKYMLRRKSSVKVTLFTTDDVNLIETKEKNIVTVKKNQALNLTCSAVISCGDINFDIHFNTNATVKF